jgi:hypothetical protein
MFTRIKDGYHNLRRHKIMVLIIIILSALCARMFHQNYSWQQPIVNIRSESYTDVWNTRAVCLTDLQEAQDAIQKQNIAATSDFK